MIKRVLALAAALTLCVMCGVCALAQTSRASDALSEPGGRVLAVARFGDAEGLPESSAEAIASCASMGVDIVSAVARKTMDGAWVLSADNDISRCFADSSGNAASGRISAMNLARLKELYLFNGRGGLGAAPSGCKIATIDEAVAACGDSVMLMLTADWGERDELYAEVERIGALDAVIFRFKAGTEETAEWTSLKQTKPVVGGYYRGNVNLSVVSAAKKCAAADIKLLELSSVNTVGVILDENLLERIGGECRLFISAADESSCGGRHDDESGWDDLISRGYSVIETDYPAGFTAYLAQTQALRVKLSEAVEKADAIDREAWKKAGTDTAKFDADIAGARAVLDDSGAARSELSDAIYAVGEALEALREGGYDTVDVSITPVKIAAVIFCTLLIAAWQVYVFRIRRAK